jgi:hypothetical protein
MAHQTLDRTTDQTGTSQTAGGGPERVTVNLSHRASAALTSVVELTGDSKTDSISRALLLYSMLHELQHDGGAIYLRENSGDLERLRIL